MNKKVLTSNESIKKSDPLIIYCTKTRRIKLTPLYVHHNTKDDEQYYKLELLEKDETGNFYVVSSGNWNIYSNKIESLYEFIQTTTELQSKDLDTIIISKDTSQKAKILTQLLKSDDLCDLFKSSEFDKQTICNLKNAIKITEIEKAIAEFEQLLETSSDKEKPFENWCKENTWAYGNYYVLTEEIHTISNAEKVDALLKNAVNDFRDIVEFKKPSAQILKFDTSHNNYYFAEDAAMAISQVINYAEIFDEVAERGLHKHEDIKGYNPKSIIIIGRTNHYTPEMIKSLHSLNSRLNNIQILSYDMLLAQCKNLLSQLKGNYETEEDDLPF